MAKRDYYQVLEVPRDADEATIKKAYRKLALKYHPDRNPGDKEAEDRFKEASEAYQVLSDPRRRAQYDRFGHAGLAGSGFDVGFGGLEEILRNFSDIFGDVFGFASHAEGRAEVSRGSDLRYDLELDFEEAVFGARKSITLRHPVPCPDCAGAGGDRAHCPVCGGRGQVRHTQGFIVISTTCRNCLGEGRVLREPCKACRGRGEVPRERTVEVTIPPGVDNGVRMRLGGQGEPGRGGGPPGDLHVFLHVKPHDTYQRQGDDLLCEVGIPYVHAALGTSVPLATLDGETIEVQVPPGTQPGDVSVQRGLGVPHLDGHGRGNLLVRFRVEIPRQLDERERELLEEIANLRVPGKGGASEARNGEGVAGDLASGRRSGRKRFKGLFK